MAGPFHSCLPLRLGNHWGHLCNWCITYLGRVDAEILERIESNEDVTNISVHLQLVISLLEMADYYLLWKNIINTHTHIIKNIVPWTDQCEVR